MSSAKKRVVDDGGGRRSVASKSAPLNAERRRKYMAAVNIVEAADELVEPEFDMQGATYCEKENLLNIRIPDKPMDMITDPEGHRLIIHDIFVYNFKSYKGEHRLGPFHKNLTMILGPNGSGKSNIIDALLFVFGFKNKKIRTNKFTNLIHASKDCDFCRVEIQFQVIKDIDNERFTIIKNSDFRISRSVRSDGLTQYKLNGEIKKQDEITKLLKTVGIDLHHNRFLILQGEVEAIALMKPTTKNVNEPGMLEYIEDIIGTHRYVVPIAKLQHRVSLLEIQSSRHAATKRRNEGYIAAFLEPAKTVVSYLNNQNLHTYCAAKLSKTSLAQYIEAKANSQIEVDKILDKKEEREEKKKEATAEVKKIEQKMQKMVTSLDSLNIQKNDKDFEIRDFRVKTDQRRTRLKELNRSMFRMDAEKAEALKALQAAQELPEAAAKEIEGIRQEIVQQTGIEKQALALAAKNMPKFEDKSLNLKQKRDDFASAYAAHNGNTIVAQTELTVAEGELRAMKVTARRDEKRLDELKVQLETNVAKLEEDKKQLVLEERKCKEAIEVNKSAMLELPNHVSADNDMRKRIGGLKANIDSWKNKDDMIDFTNGCTTKLHELHEKGEIQGFYGRLGDLGKVDKKFDPAISTIFGQMDWHITDTVDNAKKVLEQIYQRNMARVTIFQLELLDDNDLSHMDDSPHLFPAPRLFDQVQCDNRRIRECFYYVLRDMLIVDKLDEATRIDKKYKGKFRVCTFDGVTVERCGNITGGGKPTTNRIRTGNAPLGKLVTNPAELAAMQSQLARAEKEHEGIDKKILEIKKRAFEASKVVTACNSRIKDLQFIIPKQEAIVRNLKEAIREREARLNSGVIEITEQDIEVKREKVEELRRNVTTYKTEATKAKASLEEYQQKIDDIFDRLVGVHKNTAKAAADSIVKLEREVVKKEAAIANAGQVQEQIQNQLDELNKIYEEKRQEAATLGDLERDGELKDQRQLIYELDAIKSDIAIISGKLEELRNTKKEALKVEKTAIDEYEKLRIQHEDCLAVIDDTEMKIDVLTRQYESLQKKFVRPETSDPAVKLLQFTEENQAAIDAGDAVGIPPEIMELVENWEEKYYALSNVIVSEEEKQRLANTMIQCEAKLREFRRNCDDRGISQYSMLMTMVHADEYDTEHNNKEVAAHRKKLTELKKMRYTEFNDALTFLGTTTQLLYQFITNGGDASLKFVEDGTCSDPFDSGIKFSVRPAKKSWKLIENLSGGEKTLASLCFVFAIHHYRATPLYVMDEIDAALDLNNVRLIANYIKFSEKTRNAQFIIISLRNQMFEMGNRLLGIYKTDGCTHNVVIDPEGVVSGNKQAQMTLFEKINEEERKRKEEQAASQENQPVSGKSGQQPKRRRQLGRLCLADFGIGDNEEDDQVEEPVNNAQPLNLLELETGHRFDTDDEEDDEAPVRKRRVQVVDVSDEDELSPTPPPRAPPARGRRSRGSRN